MGAAIIPILQGRKLRLREGKPLAQDHTACKKQSWDLNPDCLALESCRQMCVGHSPMFGPLMPIRWLAHEHILIVRRGASGQGGHWLLRVEAPATVPWLPA